jgi:undecaprenyl-diphosphatase
MMQEAASLSSLWKPAVLGLVEGATEFIPVSSTGHLIVVADWLEFEGEVAAAFEVVIQLGAILAVLWLYRERFVQAVSGVRTDPAARLLILNLGIAFLPAAVVGFFTHDFITEHLFSPTVVAVSLVVGGIAILVIERWHARTTTSSVEEITPRLALGIGLAQILSLIPGVSRSGATIMGAMALGAGRVSATEFSFLLAVPVMLAATLYSLTDTPELLSPAYAPTFLVGFVVAFVSALLVVKAFLGFVSRYSFVTFAWYRIVVGALLLFFYTR